MQIHNRKHLEERRKKLRNNSTQAEIFLWNYLKHSKLERRKFRRQHSIGNYIVDFYCPKEKLIIELDGEVHFNNEAIEYDKRRTTFLETKGFKVIRFENQEVMYNIDLVLEKIISNFIKNI
jgi:very-short-patch-repair endonuclease